MNTSIDKSLTIAGNDYHVIINKSSTKNAPLFIYINKITEFTKFGGYIYSINDPNHNDKVYQMVLKSGDNEEMAKNLSQLMCRKHRVPTYCNINNMSHMDYPMVLMELNQLLKHI